MLKKFFVLFVAFIMVFSLSTITYADSIPREPDAVTLVDRLYKKCLDRDPDPEGFEFWVSKLESGEFTASDVVGGFFFSEEYKNFNVDKYQFIEDLYEAVLGRYPDIVGKIHWQEFYDQNFICIMSTDCGVMNGFIFSKEFENICKDLKIERGELYITNDVVTNGFENKIC